MRLLGILWLGVASSLMVCADDEFAVTWNAPFSAISPSAADSKLVVVVVTNDNPFPNRDGKPAVGRQPGQSDLWCSEILGRDLAKVLQERRDLRERMEFQAMAAGLPLELTEGQSQNQPARAVLLFCDGFYRLLGLSVSVPRHEELIAAIEDAEDVQRSMALDDQLERGKLIQSLVDRNHPRLSRMWRNVLSDLSVSLTGETNDVIRADSIESLDGAIFRLAETLQPAYEVDSKLRFGLSDHTDRRRLAILEQHPQTRGPWCNAITPFIAGVNVADHWRELIESIWGLPPIAAELDIEELTAWANTQLPSEQVVLTVTPPQRFAGNWPPDPDDRVGKAWNELHQRISQQNLARVVNLEQLAHLVRELELQPINAFHPDIARYVVMEGNAAKSLVVRGSDPPGRLSTLLDRSKSPSNIQPTP